MMDPRLSEFIKEAYNERVLNPGVGRSLGVYKNYMADATFKNIARAELDRLTKLAAAVDLPKRDFASYQVWRALQEAKDKYGM